MAVYLLLTYFVHLFIVQHCHVSHAFQVGFTTNARNSQRALPPQRKYPIGISPVFNVRVPTFTATSDDTSAIAPTFEYALLFDCDGVILETEELHRLAYNEAFRHFNVTIDDEPVVWDVEYYDKLQNTVGGGKPKMFYYFRTTREGRFPAYGNNHPPPTTEEEQKRLIDQLQDYKTQYFTTLLETKATARPGVLELMDEALMDPTIAVGVCSAATKAAAVKTLEITLGPQRVQQLNVCILGDDVSTKKPDPLIYNTACQRLNLLPSQCVVIEDSLVGLRAAVAAQMKCIITYTSSTANQDFYREGAVAKVPDLGSRNVNLESIFGPLRREGIDAEILVGLKD
jgi:HAD superfamily hydrolase (TIGR01509 family)